MKKYVSVSAFIAAVVVSPAAFADFYVSGKIGATDFVLNTYQYMYYSPDSPKSTVVDGTVRDINVSYHVGLGYDFWDMFRLDFEYGYGKYVVSGDWSLNTKNFVTGPGVVALPPNISYPSKYNLTNRVHTFALNGYYNIITFDRRYRNPISRDIDMFRQCCFDALYFVATIGMAHISDVGAVDIDTTLAWGGEPLHQQETNSLNRFMYGAGLGLSFGLSPQFSLDLTYKYLRMGNFDQSTTHREYSTHNMLVGMRYRF